MNPILQMLNSKPKRNTEDARRQVIDMVTKMTPEQRANFNKILPIISKVAESKGIDTSALSELSVHR